MKPLNLDLILQRAASGVSKDDATLRKRYTTGERPPSTLMAVPVMNDPCSEARKQARLANSSAVPMRPKRRALGEVFRKHLEIHVRRLCGVPLHPLIAHDQADQHGIDQDVVLAAFARHHLGQRHAGRPRYRGRRRGRRRRLGVGVEHVDDAAPFARLHARPDQPGEADRGKQFEVEVFLPGFVGDVLERHRPRRAGVVDEDVDRAEIGGDLLMRLGNVGSLRRRRRHSREPRGHPSRAAPAPPSGRRRRARGSRPWRPEAANCRATASPRPLLPPVTTATLSFIVTCMWFCL